MRAKQTLKEAMAMLALPLFILMVLVLRDATPEINQRVRDTMRSANVRSELIHKEAK